MNNRFIGRKGLNDDRIIKALRKAADDYENGEVSEVQDILKEIVWAIEEFDLRSQEAGACI